MEDCFHLGAKALLWNEGKVLLLKRRNYWDIPGGRLEKKEPILDALYRELEEEIGLKNVPSLSHFMMILTSVRIPTSVGDVGLILSVYHCEIPSFNPRLSEEHDQFDWFTPKHAAEVLANRYPKEFIDCFLDLFNFS